MIPGEIVRDNRPIDLNANLPVTTVSVTNTGGVAVHLTAHLHVFEANPRLRFDRRKAFGMRLDVPSGGSVRLDARQTLELRLVPIGGRRIVRGMSGVVDGALDACDPDAALARLVARGFLHLPEE